MLPILSDAVIKCKTISRLCHLAIVIYRTRDRKKIRKLVDPQFLKGFIKLSRYVKCTDSALFDLDQTPCWEDLKL